MDSGAAYLDPWAAMALLDWQAELGADEAIGDAPVNRYEAKVEPPKAAAVASSSGW